MLKRILVLYFLIALITIKAQDIEPEIPDYLRKTTTTTTTSSTTTTTTTPIPKTTKPFEEKTEAKPITTTETTSTTITTDAPPQPTTTTTTTTTTAKPWHDKPMEPWNKRCYYKVQHGHGYLKWTCGMLRWITTIDCYQCCYYEFSSFAGCFKVHNGYCNYYRK